VTFSWRADSLLAAALTTVAGLEAATRTCISATLAIAWAELGTYESPLEFVSPIIAIVRSLHDLLATAQTLYVGHARVAVWSSAQIFEERKLAN
jgi:hypothetical protein